MGRSTARVAVEILAVLVSAMLAWSPPALADGSDPCPEPNDQFQQACQLSSGSAAIGYLSTSGDIDAYRVAALDFGAQVHLELTDSPAPYRLELADWNGAVFASSSDSGVLDATLG